MTYKKITLILAIIGVLSGVVTYARGRDMALTRVEVKQEVMDEHFKEMCGKLDAIYLFLINNPSHCPKSDKKEKKE